MGKSLAPKHGKMW